MKPRRERAAAYRQKGLRYDTYGYPAGAVIEVTDFNGPVKLLSPCIAGQTFYHVASRIRRMRQEYPKASIYITIPSKANT